MGEGLLQKNPTNRRDLRACERPLILPAQDHSQARKLVVSTDSRKDFNDPHASRVADF